ncbi:protein mis18-alpha [Nannochloropsis gaditana]|uniref:Protein mis18-alpha n=1 Tax=Nannochloropsis gaditana TaxID=72520 RepID=W7UA43_9STRA|nr:protein mis18-alpha [Nannochloropsis gaditana]
MQPPPQDSLPPAPDASSANDATVTAYVVFQCAECRRIVGDSLGLSSADEELRHITLRGACGIVRGPCTRTSEEGNDRGSTFHELFCEGCSTLLGKVYLTTPPRLDGARNLFTLSTDALESFELGTYDHVCEVPQPAMAAPIPSSECGESKTSIEAMQMELVKVQNMMLVFHDRISGLERALKTGTVGARTGGGTRRGAWGVDGTENTAAGGPTFKRRK